LAEDLAVRLRRDGDERHVAVVVDARIAGELARRQPAHEREEAHAQVLGAASLDELGVGRRVLRTDRPKQHLQPVQVGRLLQLSGIRPCRQGPGAYLTSVTGTAASCSVLSETEPNTARATAPRPRIPMTLWLQRLVRARRAIVCAASPTCIRAS